jgi:hypothetical protein
MPAQKKVNVLSTANGNVFDFLPIELFRHLLQYFTLEDIGQLDTSLLNHHTRARYFFAIDGMDISLLDINISIQLQDWFLLRNFGLTELRFEHNTFSYNLLNHFRNSLSHLGLHDIILQDSDYIIMGYFPKLISIQFSCLSTLTGIEYFLLHHKHQHHLKKINIMNNLQLTNSIPMIVSHCPHLTHLNVSSNEWFDDTSLDHLTDSSIQIISINLVHTKITRQGLMRFLDKMKFSLHGLFLSPHHHEMTRLGLHHIACSSLLSHDPDTQLLGLESFSFALNSLNFNNQKINLSQTVASWSQSCSSSFD